MEARSSLQITWGAQSLSVGKRGHPVSRCPSSCYLDRLWHWVVRSGKRRRSHPENHQVHISQSDFWAFGHLSFPSVQLLVQKWWLFVISFYFYSFSSTLPLCKGLGPWGHAAALREMLRPREPLNPASCVPATMSPRKEDKRKRTCLFEMSVLKL